MRRECDKRREKGEGEMGRRGKGRRGEGDRGKGERNKRKTEGGKRGTIFIIQDYIVIVTVMVIVG